MTLELKVTNIKCEACVETIQEAIQTADPQAQVEIDMGSQTVRVDSADAEETIRQAITAAGYQIA
jgi:copper chaperone